MAWPKVSLAGKSPVDDRATEIASMSTIRSRRLCAAIWNYSPSLNSTLAESRYAGNLA
jgi:hypothetical protein